MFSFYFWLSLSRVHIVRILAVTNLVGPLECDTHTIHPVTVQILALLSKHLPRSPEDSRGRNSRGFRMYSNWRATLLKFPSSYFDQMISLQCVAEIFLNKWDQFCEASEKYGVYLSRHFKIYKEKQKKYSPVNFKIVTHKQCKNNVNISHRWLTWSVGSQSSFMTKQHFLSFKNTFQ